MGVTINGQTGRAWATTMQRSVERQRDELLAEARHAAALSVMDGAVRLQDLLEAATTRTGERRVERGGVSAGRHDTGNMVGSISYSEEEAAEVAKATEWYSFGWFSGQFEDYFRQQDLELGEGGAHALHGAFIYSREIYKARLAVIVARRR